MPSHASPPTTIQLPAPAKINWFLHICERRDDGYHNLQTAFQFIDYSDDVQFSLRKQDAVITLSPNLHDVPAEDNLIVKAAKALQQHAKTSLGADIMLTKRLPMGAGLGGGSSNAATTLLALNELWGLHLPITKLQAIGVKLGADVPIFLQGESAWAEGIGEQLTPLSLDEPWLAVITPDAHVSTAEIFSHEDLTRDSQSITISRFLEQGGRNDCQALVSKLYPDVKFALDWLNQHADAKMTGTGACVFAACTSQQHAQTIIDALPKKLHGFVARCTNTSPAHSALNQLRV